MVGDGYRPVQQTFPDIRQDISLQGGWKFFLAHIQKMSFKYKMRHEAGGGLSILNNLIYRSRNSSMFCAAAGKGYIPVPKKQVNDFEREQLLKKFPSSGRKAEVLF